MEILPWWVFLVSGMDKTKIMPFNGLSGTPLYRKVWESQRNFFGRYKRRHNCRYTQHDIEMLP